MSKPDLNKKAVDESFNRIGETYLQEVQSLGLSNVSDHAALATSVLRSASDSALLAASEICKQMGFTEEETSARLDDFAQNVLGSILRDSLEEQSGFAWTVTIQKRKSH